MEAWIYDVDLPDHIDGFYDFETHSIFIDYQLTGARRRCTIAHELEHAKDRDKPIKDPVLRRRREVFVERSAARTLITVEQMVDAIKWATDPHTVAETLDVDLTTLQARVDCLTAGERARLQTVVIDREP